MACITGLVPSLELLKGVNPSRGGAYQEVCGHWGHAPGGNSCTLGSCSLSHWLLPWSQTHLPCVPAMMYSSKEAQSNSTSWHGLEPSGLWIKTKLSFLSCLSQALSYSSNKKTQYTDFKLLPFQSYGWQVELSLRLHSCLASRLCCPAPEQGVSSTRSLLLTSQLTQHRSMPDSGLVSVVFQHYKNGTLFWESYKQSLFKDTSHRLGSSVCCVVSGLRVAFWGVSNLFSFWMSRAHLDRYAQPCRGL